jgi:hypothetical protein
MLSIDQIENEVEKAMKELETVRDHLKQLNGRVLDLSDKDRIVQVVLKELRGTTKRMRNKRTLRHWTAEQKQRILNEAAEAKGDWGGVTRVCQRYQITTAHLTQWRQQQTRTTEHAVAQ